MYVHVCMHGCVRLCMYNMGMTVFMSMFLGHVYTYVCVCVSVYTHVSSSLTSILLWECRQARRHSISWDIYMQMYTHIDGSNIHTYHEHSILSKNAVKNVTSILVLGSGGRACVYI
jgi:hypothetical protein